ncbi:MAG TPA: GNAT family N-acetyltransferase [Kofleriaceae bacterium]|nr:GNAT family N-acetyltransferase [Kofleriaceae bacterium]
MTVTIRFARVSDVPVVVELVNLAFEHEGWLIPGPRLCDADATRELFGPDLITLVATLEDTVVGAVRVRFADEHRQPCATPELGLLAVHPDAQARGLGSMLVRAAERLARGAGCDAIELKCGRELGLEAYYKALGYEWVDEEFGPKFGSYRPFTLVTLQRRLAEDQ